MNKEITPNEIANAIRDLLEERDENQEQLKEQDKTLQRWYDDYNKLNNKYDKCKIVLDKIRKNNTRIIDYGFDYDGFNNVEDLKKLIDMLVDYAKQNDKLLEEIE